jgi:hypothetical protein
LPPETPVVGVFVAPSVGWWMVTCGVVGVGLVGGGEL